MSIPSSGSHGFTFDVRVRDDALVEFICSRQDTLLKLQPGGLGSKQPLFDMAVEYYQGGGLIEFGDDTTRPFVALGAGRRGHPPGAEGRQRRQCVAFFNEFWSWNQSVSVGAHRLSIRGSILGPVLGLELPDWLRLTRRLLQRRRGIRHNTSRQCECGPDSCLLV